MALIRDFVVQLAQMLLVLSDKLTLGGAEAMAVAIAILVQLLTSLITSV